METRPHRLSFRDQSGASIRNRTGVGGVASAFRLGRLNASVRARRGVSTWERPKRPDAMSRRKTRRFRGTERDTHFDTRVHCPCSRAHANHALRGAARASQESHPRRGQQPRSRLQVGGRNAPLPGPRPRRPGLRRRRQRVPGLHRLVGPHDLGARSPQSAGRGARGGGHELQLRCSHRARGPHGGARRAASGRRWSGFGWCLPGRKRP